jgi:hypothetical protein
MKLCLQMQNNRNKKSVKTLVKKTLKTKSLKSKNSKLKELNHKNLKIKLEVFRDKVLNTSWHHMQVESGVKGLIVELIDILKEDA